MIGEARHEGGLPGSRAVHLHERRLDRGHGQDDRLALFVPELDRAPVGRDAFDGVVEGVEEHPAAELSVRDHIEAELDLPFDDALDPASATAPRCAGSERSATAACSSGGRSRLPTTSARAGRRGVIYGDGRRLASALAGELHPLAAVRSLLLEQANAIAAEARPRERAEA